MLRPRRDVNLLIPGDGFGFNLLRSYLQLLSLISLIVSFGVFLGSALARPVALFTAVVLLALSEMSPSVLKQYPDELEKNAVDAVGLFLTRAVAGFTHPVSSVQPLASLSRDVCVEMRDVLRTLLANVVVFPVVFAALAALVLRRKTEGET
jgi:ABC-type transport system involved in multi-copper enzyme maturation permease subunit